MYNYEYQKLNSSSRSNGFLAITNVLTILLVWRSTYSTSQFFTQYFSSIIYIGLFLVWFLLACMLDKAYLQKIVKNGWPLLIFLSINIFLDILNYNNIRLEQINCLIALFLYCIFIFYKDRKDCDKFKRLLLLIIVADLLIKVIYSIQQISINPAIIKQMSTEGASADRQVSILIADYSTVYACVAISVFLLGVFKGIQSKGWKTITLTTLAVFLYFIFICSFFMALLLLAYGTICVFFIKKKRNYVMLPLVFLLIVLIARMPLATFCAYMSKQTYWSEIIQGKWDDMAKLLAYGSDYAYMSDMRLDLMEESLKTFLQRPLFGVYSLNTKLKIGGHSGWLDGLGNYGILRYSLFVAFLVKFFKDLLNHAKDKVPVYAAISVYVLLSIVNPNIFPQIWVTFGVLIPFYFDLAKRNNNTIKLNTGLNSAKRI